MSISVIVTPQNQSPAGTVLTTHYVMDANPNGPGFVVMNPAGRGEVVDVPSDHLVRAILSVEKP